MLLRSRLRFKRDASKRMATSVMEAAEKLKAASALEEAII
jgi:hypothetical protein